ncbi:MAG: VOC family protein [Alphaproteobacteria bacterium]|nr:VOC family protein [Alphaproteobacteria bacterium]
MMLHHVSVGARDVARAVKFYDQALKPLGYKRVMEFMPHAVAYGVTNPEFWVQMPADGKRPTVGNGVHISFAAPSRQAVNAFHAAAIKAGGKNEGAPGPRPNYGPSYYGGFVRDLDGNKLEAVLIARPAPAKAKAKPKKAAAAKRGGARATRRK